MKALLQALPDMARLITRLVSDPVLPRPVKIALAAAAVYLVNPFDFIPDFLPFVGYLDDVLVAAIVLDGVLNYVDRKLILKYWPGTAQSLDRLARAARLFTVWVPERFKARIFAPR
jgi:uncharacterized membrane protein YkvA (DUF1232 family)